MSQVKETTLPGVGVRHEFVTKNGDRLGTVTHHSGRRDLLVFSRKDPDACAQVVRLDGDDDLTLAGLLGAAQVTHGQEQARQEVGGLSIDWLPISEAYSCSGCAISDTGLFEATGVTVVAVVRHGQVIPTPDGSFRLRANDMAVVVGPVEGIARAHELLERGT